MADAASSSNREAAVSTGWRASLGDARRAHLGLEEAQLETLASEKNPLAAPIHLEYYALLALVVILYVDILDVAGIVARFQH